MSEEEEEEEGPTTEPSFWTETITGWDSGDLQSDSPQDSDLFGDGPKQTDDDTGICK
jgi:hypothetical protein